MNRMTFNPLVALALATLFLGGCASQYIRSGKQSYNDLRYQDAIWSLEKGLVKKDDPEARRMLAESYLLTNDIAKANEQYSRVALYTDNSDRDRVMQGQALMANGKYDDARTIFEGILSRDPNNKVAASLLQGCKKLDEMKKDSLFIQVDGVNIPTTSPVYSAFPYNDGLIITSPSSKGDMDPYTNKAFTDLYFSKKEGASWGAPQPLSGVNGPYHDAVAAVSPNGQLMVFTRSFQLNAGKLGGDDNNVSNTQLYMSRKKSDGSWEMAELLPFCTQKYMFAHPTFSADGGTMYFSSNMSGSGQMDIFMVKQNEGSWGTPQNLGTEVNTTGNEVFPSMRNDGRLYFSSDGHNTLGGLDVMYSGMNDGVWSTPKHVSYPLNSSFDDFSVVWNADNKSGYFTSDRSGADRIYTFTEINPTVSLEGLVMSKDGSSPLAGAKVTIMNLTDGTETVAFTGPDGKYNAELLPGKDYKVKTEKDGFFATTEDVSTKGIISDKIIQRVTELGEVYITDKTGGGDTNSKTGQGGDSGNSSENGSNKNGQGKYPIPNIYWDYNKWEVRPDAIPYLESVVKLFRDNQDLKFEIRSHCDCRGSEGFNEDLSSKRAKAVLDYLVKRGVPRSIIVSKGIGKKELLNGCDCSEGENCTEAQHQENRRTEFIVTDKKKKK